MHLTHLKEWVIRLPGLTVSECTSLSESWQVDLLVSWHVGKFIIIHYVHYRTNYDLHSLNNTPPNSCFFFLTPVSCR